MRKIVAGKLYDTETAREVAFDGADCSYRDLGYYEQRLYLKKTGEFFMYGEGGPMTQYCSKCGSNSYGWGEYIKPFSKREAREWVEEHCSVDKYIELFGEVEE